MQSTIDAEAERLLPTAASLRLSLTAGVAASGRLIVVGSTKGEVLAAIDVPDQILRKAPSADLWPGQTDEDEAGFERYGVTDLHRDVVTRSLVAAETG